MDYIRLNSIKVQKSLYFSNDCCLLTTKTNLYLVSRAIYHELEGNSLIIHTKVSNIIKRCSCLFSE